MAGERHLATRMIEVNADLPVDNDVELRADITAAEHGLAFRVMPRDHQPVDARELIERERAEERDLLQRDQLFHVVIESVDCRLRRLAYPLVRVFRELFEIRVRQRPSEDGVERIRFEKPG